MIDLSVPRIPLELKNDMSRTYAPPVLADGYHFTVYQDGDQRHWAQLMCSVGFFRTMEDGEKCFQRSFLYDPETAKRHVFFVVSDSGEYVGTCACWNEDGYDKLHWLAVLPSCQGKRLGNALVQKVLYTFQQEGVAPVYLDTQTTSHRAICLYLKEGFAPLRIPRRETKQDDRYAEAVEILREKMPEKYFAMYQTAERDR